MFINMSAVLRPTTSRGKKLKSYGGGRYGHYGIMCQLALLGFKGLTEAHIYCTSLKFSLGEHFQQWEIEQKD